MENLMKRGHTNPPTSDTEPSQPQWETRVGNDLTVTEAGTGNFNLGIRHGFKVLRFDPEPTVDLLEGDFYSDW